MTESLAGLRIAVPESRELDLFVSMLERAGANALRCPLVSIHDVDDPAPVEAWIGRLAGGAYDDLVLYTGEGVTRLRGVAQRAGLADAFVDGLRRVRKIVRGPKPVRALRLLGLSPDLMASEPTTEGLIALLSGLPLNGRRIAVQVYPDQGATLLDYLAAAGATHDSVQPYRYASDREDGRVADLIRAMAAGEIDVLALTSRPQVRRIVDVAERHGLVDPLAAGTSRTLIAAVGPVTADAARAAGWRVAVVPSTNFHLKPFIAEIGAVLAGRGQGGGGLDGAVPFRAT